jgi:2-dehydro-3-deoxyglucarate aldolase
MNAVFKRRLLERQVLFGTMLTTGAVEVAEILAHLGYDWLFIDTEHSPLSTMAVRSLIQAAGKVPCLVRLADHGEVSIKNALDSGAAGIIAPQVNSAKEAEEIVAYCKYPPAGKRGVGLSRASKYGLEFSDYVSSANTNTSIVLQIEHVEAVNNVQAILSVEGVDAIFVGPYDLSTSMGKPGLLEDLEVVAAINTVADACIKAKMPIGYFGMDVNDVIGRVQQGFNLLCSGLDLGFVIEGGRSNLKSLNSIKVPS